MFLLEALPETTSIKRVKKKYGQWG